jgi:branched-chain amino acid transport system substrate-binding protein
MISPSSTNPKVTETGDYIFRVCFIDPFQGTVMANFARNTLKAKKVAVFTDVKSDYSVGLAKYFRERFTKAAATVVAEQSFSGGDKDFKAQLTAIKAANPDACSSRPTTPTSA